jgi:hypothetical protein
MLKTADTEKGNRRVNERVIDWCKQRNNLYLFLFNHALCVTNIFDHSDKLSTLMNRDNELYLPLFSIADYIDRYIDRPESKILPTIQKYAGESVSEEESLDDWSVMVLKAINDLTTDYRTYLIKDIKKQINNNREIDDDPISEKMTNKWIGTCLKKFGFRRGKPTREGKTYWLKREHIEDLKRRYGIFFDGHDGNNGNSEAEIVPTQNKFI